MTRSHWLSGGLDEEVPGVRPSATSLPLIHMADHDTIQYHGHVSHGTCLLTYTLHIQFTFYQTTSTAWNPKKTTHFGVKSHGVIQY